VRSPLDKKGVIKQWKISKRFDAYNPNFAESQDSLLKKSQLGPAKAQSELPGKVQSTVIVQTQQVSAPKTQSMMDEEPEEVAEEEEAFPMSEHAKSLTLLNKAEMTKYLGDLTVAKDALLQAGLELPKLVNYHNGSNSVSFLGNLVARLGQQTNGLLTGDQADKELLERCKQAVLENTKSKDRMMRVLESGKLSILDYKGIVDRELTETLNVFKAMKKFLKNSKPVGEFMISHVKILQEELAELTQMSAQ